MNFVDLKNALKNEPKPAYLINGTDIFLVQKSIDMIAQTVGVQNPVLDISRLDNKATSDTIVAECLTLSFMGGKRIVIVRPFEIEQYDKALKKYLDKPNLDCVLIMVSDSPKPPTIKNAETVNCNPMTPDILTKLIANQLNSAGKKITQDAANLLCQYCNNIYARIDNELNKLINFYADIELLGTDEIKSIVTRPTEHQIFELSNTICRGNLEQSEQVLRALLDRGEDEYAIFASLVSAFRRLFYSLTCKSDQNTVASVLGCNPFAVQYARRDNRHLTEQIVALYEYALDLEYQIKSGKISTISAITLLNMACTQGGNK